MAFFVSRRFCGKLLLDLAHLGQAEKAVHACWVRCEFCVQAERISKFAETKLMDQVNCKTLWKFAEQPRNGNTAYSRLMRFNII